MTQMRSDTPRIAVPEATINPQLAGGPTLLSAVGRGAAEVGAALQQVQDKRDELDFQRQRAAGITDLLIAEAKAREAAENADPQQAESLYAEHLDRWREAASGITNERAREAVLLQGERDFGLGGVAVQRDSFKRLRQSTIDQTAIAVDNAVKRGEFDKARAIAAGSESAFDDIDYHNLLGRIDKAENDSLRDALEAQKDTVKARIEFVGEQIHANVEAPAEVRDTVLSNLNDQINGSDQPQDVKLSLLNSAKADYDAGVDAARVHFESIVSDTTGLAELDRVREQAFNAIPDSHAARKRFVAHANNHARILKEREGDIDLATNIYLGKPVPEGTLIPNDDTTLNAVYQKGLNIGDSPEKVIGRMAQLGFATPPKFRDYVGQQFSEDGNKFEGAAAIRALAQHRPGEARRIASDIGDKATTALWLVTDGAEFGFTEQTARKVLESPRYNAAIQEFNLYAGVTSRKNDKTSDLDIEPWRIMKGERPQSGIGRLMPGSKTGFDESKVVTNSEMKDFLNAYRASGAAKVILNNVDYNDETRLKEIIGDSVATAKVAARFDKVSLPTGPGGADPTSYDMRLFGLMGANEPGTAQGNKHAIRALNDAIEDATNIALSGDTTRFMSTVRSTELVPRKVRAVPSDAFMDKGRVIVPLAATDSSDMVVAKKGYLVWDQTDFSHSIVFDKKAGSQIQNLRREADAFGVFEGDVALSEPHEVYDDTLFGRYRAIQESGGIAEPTRSLSPWAWDPSYGNVSVAEFNPEWLDGFMLESAKELAAEHEMDVEQFVQTTGGPEAIEQRATEKVRSAGWPSLVPEKTNARNTAGDNQ